MKTPTLLNSVLVVVAILSPTACAASCSKDSHADGGFAVSYIVDASGVPDIPGICGGLWDNLKGFPSCGGPTQTWCGGKNGNLEWRFTASIGCDGGSVDAVWWGATKNAWGDIQCPF